MTQKVLFVGGCADGQWREKPDSEFYKIPRPPLSISPLQRDPIEQMVRCDLYRRERLRSGNREWECYVLDSLNSQDFIERLIDGYMNR